MGLLASFGRRRQKESVVLSDGKTVIGVDVDGVLRDFRGSVDRQYGKIHPDSPINHEHRDYSLAERYPAETSNYIGNFVFRAFAREIFLGADIIPGAERFFDRLLMNKAFHVGIITSQSRITGPLTLEWLGRNGFNPAFVHIVPFRESKAHVDDRVDILIDDKIENLIDFEASGRRAICFAQEWNEGWRGERYDNFDDLCQSL